MEYIWKYLHLDLEGEHIVLPVPAVKAVRNVFTYDARQVFTYDAAQSCCPPPYDPSGTPIMPFQPPVTEDK